MQTKIQQRTLDGATHHERLHVFAPLAERPRGSARKSVVWTQRPGTKVGKHKRNSASNCLHVVKRTRAAVMMCDVM